MERMLRYSLDRKRKIRVMWQQDGQMRQKLCQVIAMNAECVELDIARPREQVKVALTDILSADYRKGDEAQLDD